MKSLVKRLVFYASIALGSSHCGFSNQPERLACDPHTLEGVVVDERFGCTPTKYSQHCSYAVVVDTEQGRYSMGVVEQGIPLIALEAVVEKGSVVSFPTSGQGLGCPTLFSADKIGEVYSGDIHLPGAKK